MRNSGVRPSRCAVSIELTWSVRGDQPRAMRRRGARELAGQRESTGVVAGLLQLAPAMHRSSRTTGYRYGCIATRINSAT